MFSLFRKKNREKFTDEVSRSRYFIEKELLLKGMIHEEKVLRDEYHEMKELVPSFCLFNRIHSPYFDLVSDIKNFYGDRKPKELEDCIDQDGKVEWGEVLDVKSTKELKDVFVDSLSILLNIKELEDYLKILNEELMKSKKHLGVYKSSWGYMNELNRRLKELKSNMEFLKKHHLFLESVSFRIELILEFDFFGNGSVDINRQYFRVVGISGPASINSEMNAKDCLKVIQLRNWGEQIKHEIKDYLELRSSGIELEKLGDPIFEELPTKSTCKQSKFDVN